MKFQEKKNTKQGREKISFDFQNAPMFMFSITNRQISSNKSEFHCCYRRLHMKIDLQQAKAIRRDAAVAA